MSYYWISTYFSTGHAEAKDCSLNASMSEVESMLPTTLPGLVDFFLASTLNTIAFCMSLAALAIASAATFSIPIVKRTVARDIWVFITIVMSLVHLGMLLLFSIPDEKDAKVTTPTAPSFLWALAWSSSIVSALLIGIVFSVVTCLYCFHFGGLLGINHAKSAEASADNKKTS